MLVGMVHGLFSPLRCLGPASGFNANAGASGGWQVSDCSTSANMSSFALPLSKLDGRWADAAADNAVCCIDVETSYYYQSC